MPLSPPSFPTDVVQQIFSFFSEKLSTNNPTRFPWFLGHICSTWRSLYLSMTTEFWYSFSISFDPKRSMRTTISIIRFFIERNPEDPISFTFEFPHYPHHLSEFTQQQVDDIGYIIEMLVDSSMRWEDVYFFSRATDLLPLIRVKNRLPLLRALRLSLIRGFDEVPDQLYNIFEVAPSLNLIYTEDLADWKFNWSNLKNMTTSRLGSGAFVTALPQMTKLERLLIHTAFGPLLTSVVVLPHLRMLHCHVSWLPSLKAPALAELTVSSWSESSDHDSDSADSSSSDITLSFLHRSSCTILLLGIESTGAATAIEIIRHTPHVVHLYLVDITNTGNVLEELTISPNPTQVSLARHMVSLEIYDDGDDVTNDDIGQLCRLILSRSTNCAANNDGHKKLEGLRLDGRLSGVSENDKFVDLLSVCEEHDVGYNE
ncbi:hypothetical protein APHAL10511_008541 [Amanita phalloides]|nr:hypothetical protein APHAL10511_008541 [Amanita phalloides]